ncbi:Pkinase-domain-containing protein [Gigaspora margarita]|uniref:Pkinase-domain-containing protein n=1 Tax=Gigaspora margarita TaxID=4874 RepID=A0A8H4AK36_GIGMA|nr:Pkinase-domain-containing protein [Gigaspora margarita]
MDITFESVRQWKVDQVSNWLQENDFWEYQKLFAENDINGDVLLELDHEILKELRIRSIGDRLRLLNAVRSLLKLCAGNNLPYHSIFKYAKEPVSPETDKFPISISRSNSNARVRARSNSSNRGHYSPNLTSINAQQEIPIIPIESIKQSTIKVYGEGEETRTISLNNIVDSESILKRILQKFKIDEDVENYSLFATLSDTGETRSLSDEEIVEICKSSDRPEREKLTLRKKHLPPKVNYEQSKNQKKDLEKFFGEKIPTSPQVGVSRKKLREFFGQRPPSELIQLNLTEYFPGHNSEELERSVARNSIYRHSIYRRGSRASSASKFSIQKSKRTSKLDDDDNSDGSNTIITSNNNSDRFSMSMAPSICSESTIQEQEEEEDVDYFQNFDYEDEEDLISEPEIVDVDQGSKIKWIKGNFIGMGSFGSVYLGLNSFTGELMAVKQVELPTENSSNNDRKKSMLDALQREITLLEELQHENIVQYLGSQYEKGTFNIFLEYVPGGSVATMLNNYGPLEEPLIQSFVRQILQGLNYLHEKDIIHRDIKGANILVEDQFMAATSARPSLQGSVFWMAPEVIKQTPYTSKADIWSLGCLIVEMFTGDHPFPEFNQTQAMFKVQ